MCVRLLAGACARPGYEVSMYFTDYLQSERMVRLQVARGLGRRLQACRVIVVFWGWVVVF